jgi:hypothetical protein
MTLSKSWTARLTWIFAFVSFAIAAAPRTIYKDVAILGEGASGAHAAVRLREDFNNSIIIVEKQDNLVCFSSSLPLKPHFSSHCLHNPPLCSNLKLTSS